MREASGRPRGGYASGQDLGMKLKQHPIGGPPGLTKRGQQWPPENPEHPWTGEHGYIDGAMLERHLEAGSKPIWYMTGPPPMVGAMRKLMASRGVSEDDVRFEEFSGY